MTMWMKCRKFLKKCAIWFYELCYHKNVHYTIPYERLLYIANQMHLYIFIHTGDEQQAYDEIGLTERENQILGYSGEFKFQSKENDE